MNFLYKCLECGTVFKSYNPKPKFCSKRCKIKSQISPANHAEIKKLYLSGKTQCEVALALGITQKVVYSSLKRQGVQSRKAKKRNQTGDDNDNWKGGKTIAKRGYVLLKCKGHPRSRSCGDYVLEHILIIEQHLGRRLIWKGPSHPDTEVVHHRNGITSDNRIENLEVMTFKAHVKLHTKLRKEVMQNA